MLLKKKKNFQKIWQNLTVEKRLVCGGNTPPTIQSYEKFFGGGKFWGGNFEKILLIYK